MLQHIYRNSKALPKHIFSIHTTRACSATTNVANAAPAPAAPVDDHSQILDACGAEPYSDTFATNKERMDTLVQALREEISKLNQGGGPKAVARHRRRGKLLPRERISAVLDPGSPFLELSQPCRSKPRRPFFLISVLNLFFEFFLIFYRPFFAISNSFLSFY